MGKTLSVNFEIVKGKIPALSETQKPVAKTGEAATYTGSPIQLISPPPEAAIFMYMQSMVSPRKSL